MGVSLLTPCLLPPPAQRPHPCLLASNPKEQLPGLFAASLWPFSELTAPLPHGTHSFVLQFPVPDTQPESWGAQVARASM